MIELSDKIETPIIMLAHDQPAPVRVTHLYDRTGEEVATWQHAYRFVAGPLDSGEWLSGLCEEFRVVQPH